METTPARNTARSRRRRSLIAHPAVATRAAGQVTVQAGESVVAHVARPTATAAHVATPVLVLILLAAPFLGAALSGCSLFSPREPEDPLAEGGTFEQPDTPEQVIENIEASVAELNTLNYRRSLRADLVFHPTATAESREPVFANWGRPQEEQYFSAMVAAASMNTGHQLRLNDQSFTILSDSEYLLDATYVLTINHSRPDAPSEAQGRLQWIIRQDAGGLWELAEWTDQELGSNPSWSNLKAEFMK